MREKQSAELLLAGIGTAFIVILVMIGYARYGPSDPFILP